MKPFTALALASLAAACGGAPASPSPPVALPSPSAAPLALPAPPPTPRADAGAPASREDRLIAQTLHRVELARGIQATRPVPGVLLDRPALIARVKEHVAQELPPRAIHDEGLEVALFGFIPTQFDYEGAEYALLQDQLAGYYEPADGTMYMASDLGSEESGATLAHELVHALQDQRWDLGKRSKYRAGEGDRSEALSALAEGDATSAMFDVMIASGVPGSGRTAIDVPDDVFVQQIRAGMGSGPGAQSPRIMRTSLVAPYIYGTVFVHGLRRKGGWAEVDRAWADPPATTEQILHLDKWAAREPPLPVAAPTFAALGAGWAVLDEDSEGELGMRIALEEWTDEKLAAELSSGWGGDRGVLVASGDRSAFAWRLRYDAVPGRDGRATKLWHAVSQSLDRTLGKPAAADASFNCHERADRGPMALTHAGSDLVLVLGPARVSPDGWKSAGDCALARRWVREILASP